MAVSKRAEKERLEKERLKKVGEKILSPRINACASYSKISF